MASSAEKTFHQALAFLQAGKLDDAERAFKKLLREQPRHVGGLNLFSILLTRLGRFEEAEFFIRRALNEGRSSDATFYNYGIILKALHRPSEALEKFGHALAINDTVAETWNGRGTIFNDLARYEEAIADFDRAISLKPNYAEAYSNKGKSLAKLQFYDQSLAAYERALALNPYLAEAWTGRGNVLIRLRRHEDAAKAYDKALAAKPELAEAWLGRGNLCTEFRQYKDAFAAFDRALALKPDLAEAWLGRGSLFAELARPDDALAAYDRALSLQSDLVEAWVGRGNVFTDLKQHEKGLAAYERAYSIDPAAKYLDSGRLHARLMICDWTGLQHQVSHFMAATRNGAVAIPLQMLSMPSSAADQLACAQRYVADRFPSSHPPLWQGQIYSHDRIRVAYISSDLRDHPVAHLTAGLFEQHDKSHFELTAIALGPQQPSAMRRRIESAFEHFVDAGSCSDRDIAELIRQREIDIAIDLNGFTQHSRTGVFARRPAPIQVVYLGYSGSMGADYYDYIVADQTVIPEDQTGFYAERVIWLPDCFLVNDASRYVGPRIPTRSECGLPERAVVFCCFNNLFKIMPDVFDVWMRLLRAGEGSVLWLGDANSTARSNLCREAESRGVASERLVFAPRLEAMAEHLARHRAADLFLDTMPYNAHTTASDSLWAGVPVLTCLGSTFASRVAASLLNAVGIPELIASSPTQYERLALDLAHNPNSLAALKAKLARNRLSCPLFDTPRFTRNIEAAYTAMWERYQRGQAPIGFAVERVPT